MKLAYIILAHKNAKQVYRLYKRLSDADTTVVIHMSTTADKGFSKEMRSTFRNETNVHFCKREDGTHNGFGIVKGILNALNSLIEKNIEFDYVSLLSGQDYPIKPNNFIKNYFLENAGKEFIKFWPMFPSEGSIFSQDHPWGHHRQLYRIDRYHIKFCGKVQSIPELLSERLISHNLFNTLKIFVYETPKYLRKKKWTEEALLLFFSRILPHRRKIPENFELFGGKTWWSLTKACAKYIVDFSKKNKKFNQFYKYTLIPDEMYFQTILLNSPFKEKIENNYLREIEWAGGDGTHPITFKKNDFEYLKNSSALFARKFDIESDEEIINMIASEILGK